MIKKIILFRFILTREVQKYIKKISNLEKTPIKTEKITFIKKNYNIFFLSLTNFFYNSMKMFTFSNSSYKKKQKSIQFTSNNEKKNITDKKTRKQNY